ncbi:MAG: PEGA domain-containing protein [Opitutaceae bacterium]
MALSIKARFTRSVVLSLLAIWFSGCAAVTTGQYQKISINSEPPGAKVLVDGVDEGVTPIEVQMVRKTSHLVELILDGYDYYDTTIEPKMNNAVFGNIVAGGAVGMIIDESSGASNSLQPSVINAVLTKSGN